MGGDFRSYADAGMAALDRWYDRRRGLWATTGWWNAANALTTTVDYTARTGVSRYLDVVTTTWARHRRGGFLNEFYDDQGWWALAWLDAHDLIGEPGYLEAARRLFADMTGGWDETCGGGLWWSKQRTYKNAITTALFATVAARLHGRPGPGDPGREPYLEWAWRAWGWFESSGLINADKLVNDGLTGSCANNAGTTWTYNQGAVVGALVQLHHVTGEASLLATARAVADAALASLTGEDGIVREPCEPSGCDGDQTQFKGILMRNLLALYQVTGGPAYAACLRRNAESIWSKARNGADQFGLCWAGPFDRADASRQSSALDAILAALASTGR